MFTKLKRSYRWLLRKRVRDSGLLFTRNNIRIDREIDYDGAEICAYIEVWFDPDKKFGLKLGDDEYVNVYALISPDTGYIRMIYIIYYADGFIDDARAYKHLTPAERTLILEMVSETSADLPDNAAAENNKNKEHRKEQNYGY